jgi:hypothetical protein
MIDIKVPERSAWGDARADIEKLFSIDSVVKRFKLLYADLA